MGQEAIHMKRAAYPHAKPYHDHRGARRWRYRRKGFSCEIGRAFGSDEFKARYEASEAEFLGKKAEGAGADRTRPGSFGDLVQRWYRSAELKALEASTQANYRRQVEPVRMRFASDPLAELRRKHIAALLAEKSETPSAANNLRKRLCQILGYGVSLDMIAQNPPRQVKPYRIRGEGFKTWDEGQIARYLEVHRPGTIARVALLLMLHTGAARVDAVALGPWNLKAGRFEYRRSKTEKTGGDLISIPLQHDLAAELDSLPKDRPYLALSGDPVWQTPHPRGLGNAMRK